MEVTTLGSPTQPGIYAARQWYGWRILEWYDGAWWHIGRQCAWPKKAEIDAFIGPLPVVARDFTAPAFEPEDWEIISEDIPVQEFDL